MTTLITLEEAEPSAEASFSDHWQRALTAEASAEREAAAWSVFLTATPGSELPGFCKDCVPSEVLPLLTAARERSLGRCFMTPLASMRSDSDETVRAMSGRALVRLWLLKGDWDSNAARGHVRKLRFVTSQEAIEEAINEFSPSDLQSSLDRLRADDFHASPWAAPLGFMTLVAMGLALVGIAFGFKLFGILSAMGGLVFQIGRTLIRPGSNRSDGRLKRWAPLLAQIEEHVDEDPKALKGVELELRLLTLRISDQPKEVREAAVRLVRLIEEIDRNIGQLPIAAAPAPLTAEALPVPSIPTQHDT